MVPWVYAFETIVFFQSRTDARSTPDTGIVQLCHWRNGDGAGDASLFQQKLAPIRKIRQPYR
jgi:hypothetical protein